MTSQASNPFPDAATDRPIRAPPLGRAVRAGSAAVPEKRTLAVHAGACVVSAGWCRCGLGRRVGLDARPSGLTASRGTAAVPHAVDPVGDARTRRFAFFFLNDPAPPEIYPLPLHDALPI